MGPDHDGTPDPAGRSEVFSSGRLSRLTRRIRHHDQSTVWLRAAGLDPGAELERWYAERRALLAERAAGMTGAAAGSGASGCPAWTWAEDVVAPRTIPGRVESGPGGRLTGHAPCAISEGTHEFPGDARPISTEVRDASVGFAGTIVDTDTGSHWYRDWRFEAALPPAPWDGRLEYGFYLFCDAWWYATSVSLDGWLQLFVTTFKPRFEDEEEDFCETFFVVDVGWPGDDDNGRLRRWVHVSGESAVRAGQAPTVGFNAHLYAGLTAGEATLLGGFMPHDRAGERLDDPWPPPHAGEVRYAFEPEQVIALR